MISFIIGVMMFSSVGTGPVNNHDDGYWKGGKEQTEDPVKSIIGDDMGLF